MGSGASSATPCLAGFFALRCFSLITIWVTPESWAVKLITSLPHWFYTRILRVPKCFPAVGPSLDANSLHNSGVTMAGRNLGQALEKIGHRDSGSLCARTLGSVAALLRQWSTGDRQQRGGTSLARCRAWKKELSFRGLGWWRRECSNHVQLDRNGKIKRTRPGKLPAQRTISHRRSSDQSHRGTSPLECRGRSCCTLTPRCLIDPI